MNRVYALFNKGGQAYVGTAPNLDRALTDHLTDAIDPGDTSPPSQVIHNAENYEVEISALEDDVPPGDESIAVDWWVSDLRDNAGFDVVNKK